MENSLIQAFMTGNELEPNMEMARVLYLLGHSLILGTILSTVTYIISLTTSFPPLNDPLKEKKLRAQTILGASNIVFLCVGLTGVMILVNNNLARALAIGATMALMRFRVKLGQKNLSSNLLFGIIAGVACGLQVLPIAWCLTIVYVFIQVFLYLLLYKTLK